MVFTMNPTLLINAAIRGLRKFCIAEKYVVKRSRANIESLESRTLLSESASAQLELVSTTGTQSSPVYNYAMTLTNTGTTNLGTYWFAWIPGEDFLPSLPSTVSDPAGWSHAITGSNSSGDGSAIRWEASTVALTPGQSLSGFDFSTADSPTALEGDSPTHPSMPALTSFTYIAAPFADAGFQFVATAGTTTVTPTASTTTLVSSASTVTAGSSVTFTTTVASSTGSGATPTGTVKFLDDGSSIGTGTVQAGVATLTTTTLPTGSLSITAEYGGDSAYASSTSSPIIEVVNPAVADVSTTIALTSSTASATFGTSVAFTATVTAVTAGVTPTGTVAFTESGTSIGSADVQSNGTATLSLATLPVGAEPIIATYSGDSVYAGSTSTALTETITSPPTLVPFFIKSTVPASIVAGFTAHGAVTLHITNETGQAIKGKKSTVTVFASTTGSIDGASISLFSVTRVLKVSATTPTPLVAQLKILAATLPAGSYTLIARVIDPSSNITDTTGSTLTVAAPRSRCPRRCSNPRFPRRWCPARKCVRPA
jgi:hypothetical protein